MLSSQRHAVGDAELLQQLVAEAQDLDVGLRLGGADDLGVELVELAEAALLRALVAERRAVGRDLQRRVLLPAFAQIGAADAGGELGPQRDRIPRRGPRSCTFPWTRHRWSRRSVRANTCGRLDRRHFDPLEAEQAAHAIERRDDRGEAVGVFSKQALRAPNGLNRRHCARAKAHFCGKRNQRRGCCPRLRWRSRISAEEARRRQEQLADADPDRPAERVEQVGLVVERDARRPHRAPWAWRRTCC